MATHRDALNEILSTLKLQTPKEREPALHYFFEARPDLIALPHYIHSNVVLSKLELGNWTTDFAYIHPQSGFHMLYLVEIEDAEKKIFNDSNDEFSQPFNHALQQVHDWMEWVSNNRDHVSQLYNDLNIQFRAGEYGMLMPTGVLIYGRRDETERNALRMERWRRRKLAELTVRIEVMTYDGLMGRNLSEFTKDTQTESRCTTYRYSRRAFHKK